MSDVVIEVCGLGKRYRIGEAQPQGIYRYKALRDALAGAALRPFRALRALAGGNGRAPQPCRETIWALKDVSFEVRRGEVLGVIGRNGAGKSTLLKVLSRITEPTEGRARVRGRIGSLLEVGTGFHPELTGRENIYLNGAILGMRRAEIDRRFDEMVAFAEIEKFLDTPVKHYSSGMYMRLAFSVAAHLDPEILLVDEVLAVGDAAFQKKCLGKMGEVAKEGRTVLFVSHNMAAVENLCGRCLWLSEGRLARLGRPEDAIREYLSSDAVRQTGEISLADHPNRARGSRPVMESLCLVDAEGRPASSVRMQETLGVRVRFRSPDGPVKPVLGVVVRTLMGTALFGVSNRFIPAPEVPASARSGEFACWLKNLPLMPGLYWLDVYFGDHLADVDVIFQAASFEVLPADVFGTGQLCPAPGGPVCWPATFEYRDAAARPCQPAQDPPFRVSS